MRKIWAKIFRERYDAKDPRSLLCRMHCQTYAPTLTRQQPFNNLIRSTIYALAAIMGGVQSLHVNSFDEALSIPTEFSALLSVRTQQIISLETGITSVIDPLGGSYYVEWLTNQLEKEAMTIIDAIQSMGGAFKAWDWMCNEIRRAAVKSQEEFDAGKRFLVGVNTLVDQNDIQMKALKVLQEYADFEALYEYTPSIIQKQIARLNKVRRERDEEKLERAKKELIDVMKAGQNMILPLIKAVQCGLTRGEFARIKSEVFNLPGEGPYVCRPPLVLA
jgi:methylmalonyl-CoA mutase N-terminal domain/subunit